MNMGCCDKKLETNEHDTAHKNEQSHSHHYLKYIWPAALTHILPKALIHKQVVTRGQYSEC